MSSKWTNKSAIMRDLARVQGRVPVAVNSTLAAGDQPPEIKIVEETEEAFYRQGLGEGDFDPPELHRIQEMLELVRGKNVDDEDTNTAYEITKVNHIKNAIKPHYNTNQMDKPSTSKQISPQKPNEFRSKKKNPKDIIEQMIGREKQMNSPSNSSEGKKKRRNIAMESIMSSFNNFGIEDSKLTKENAPVDESNNIPVRLLKPTDFEVATSTEKVQYWFQEQETRQSYSPTLENIQPQKSTAPKVKSPKPIDKSDYISQKTKSNISLKTKDNVKSLDESPNVNTWMKVDFNPTSMFKRKVKKEEPIVLPVQREKSPKKSAPTNYVPSSMAQEYYKKYMIKQMIHEDIWTKVGERIDEIEAEKEAEVERQRQLALQKAEKLRLLQDAIYEISFILIDDVEGIEINAATDENNSTQSDLKVVGEDDKGPIREPDSVIANEKTENCDTKFDINLPVHRHLLTEDCIVCEVLCGKRNKKEEKAIENWREKCE